MDAETATVLRGRAKAALTRIINFIDKNDQTFDKNDIRNKLEKLELTYTEFDKADAALPIESSEMEEFETKYYETKAKLQNIKRGFWKKWSSEFISSLQPRKKWQDAQPNLKEDDIVLIKEEGPPGTWPMARVLQVHPGNDGLVRVATVKTQDSVFKRPVHKLHKLPIYPN
ncbi:integrase catalytic domain-containing protein [Trichonephila clavipes]|nr:integrase catalytic domain-containing protein [Trichonephila clavipes]